MNADSRDAPVDRFCDLVMKGGITSGIVYPPLAYRLAQHYRFKNIGGTSAGAIAAAATAAAEFSRRHTGSAAAFDTLRELPGRLGEMVSGGERTKLLSLFQPTAGCHRLFLVLVGSLNAKGTWHRVGAIAFGLLRAYWMATLAAAAAGAYVGRAYGAHAGISTAVILLLVFIGLWVYRDVGRHLPANGYGMCTGMTAPRSATEALTPWLHRLIQSLAGLPEDGQPLTFGQLWDAPGFPPPWLTPPPDTTVRSIDLRMFTTNLSTGRPFVLPLTEETCRLFYLPQELKPLLPQSVYDWLVAHSRDYAPDPKLPGSDPPADRAPEGLKELPEGKDFPVLLAARMSLSFPILFSAIPLWAIDYDPQKAQRGFERCMFSDGGISSNFPVHLFDGLLPMWPTFGVQLEPKLPERDNMIFLPKRYFEGYGERWDRFASKASSVSRMGGFLAAIVSTMQNWNDNTLSRMPGVRDRVVRVRLNDNEGGMNLNMQREVIAAVASRGDEAARELVARYLGPAGSNAPAPGWDEQRWIRLGVSLSMLARRFIGVELALRGGQPHSTDYPTIIGNGANTALPGEPGPLGPAQVAALQDCVIAMKAFNASVAGAITNISFETVPETDLRVRPSL